MKPTTKIEHKHTANDKESVPKCSLCRFELYWRNKEWRCMFSRCPEYGKPQEQGIKG